MRWGRWPWRGSSDSFTASRRVSWPKCWARAGACLTALHSVTSSPPSWTCIALTWWMRPERGSWSATIRVLTIRGHAPALLNGECPPASGARPGHEGRGPEVAISVGGRQTVRACNLLLILIRTQSSTTNTQILIVQRWWNPPRVRPFRKEGVRAQISPPGNDGRPACLGGEGHRIAQPCTYMPPGGSNSLAYHRLVMQARYLLRRRPTKQLGLACGLAMEFSSHRQAVPYEARRAYAGFGGGAGAMEERHW